MPGAYTRGTGATTCTGAATSDNGESHIAQRVTPAALTNVQLQQKRFSSQLCWCNKYTQRPVEETKKKKSTTYRSHSRRVIGTGAAADDGGIERGQHEVCGAVTVTGRRWLASDNSMRLIWNAKQIDLTYDTKQFNIKLVFSSHYDFTFKANRNNDKRPVRAMTP
jgi:hypothetical protein